MMNSLRRWPVVNKTLWGIVVLMLVCVGAQTVRLGRAQKYAAQAEKNMQNATNQVHVLQQQLADDEDRISGLLAESEVMQAQLRELDNENNDIKEALQKALNHDESAKNWAGMPIPAGVAGVLNKSKS